jgi:hypothetical protein
MATRARVLILAAAGWLLASGCGPRGYEFLKMPQAGLQAGSRWKPGLGPVSDGPAAGVEVTEKARGLDWLLSESRSRSEASLNSALAGFFSAGLEIDAKQIALVEARGLTHRRVADPEKLERGGAYLWETVEASKVRLIVDRSLSGELKGRLDKFGASGAGKKLGLQFQATDTSRSSYEISGRNLVVAVKVVEFDVRTAAGKATLKLGKETQGSDQPGPLGYTLAVEPGGVDLPGRKVAVRLRNPAAADSDTGTWKRTLTGATAKVHAGPVVGERGDCVIDSAYVSAWDPPNLACEVTFQRTVWELRQVGCGLETVK